MITGEAELREQAPLWSHLAHEHLRLALGEVAPADALRACVDLIEQHERIPCECRPNGDLPPAASSRAPAADPPQATPPLVAADGRVVGTLALFGPARDPALFERLAQVMAAIVESAHHRGATRAASHRNNNLYAVVLANLEYAVAIAGDPPTDLLRAQPELQQALRLALEATRSLVDSAKR